MRENGAGTISLLVLIVSAVLAVLSIPNVPGVHGNGKQDKTIQISTPDPRYVNMIRHNYDGVVNGLLESQFALHLKNSYEYLCMAYYFERTDQALKGFASYFKRASEQELANSNFLMSYINKRGGYFEMSSIDMINFNPAKKEKAATKALRKLLRREKQTYAKLVKAHKEAGKFNDIHVTHMLEDVLINQKIELIRDIEVQTNILDKFSEPDYNLGVFILDKQIQFLT